MLVSTAATDPEGVRVTVSDSGSELPHANPERIFDAFYATKSDGLGQGLSICRSIGMLRAMNHGLERLFRFDCKQRQGASTS